MHKRRLNCWEFRNCGQGPDNPESICPVPKAVEKNGINGGFNAGRYCWVFPGTRCAEGIQSSFERKPIECLTCEFFRLVEVEEGSGFSFIEVQDSSSS